MVTIGHGTRKHPDSDLMARPRSDDYSVKQKHIVDCATAVFADLGIDQASMSQIAKRASVSKTLLYHYYDSKSDLLFDIIHQHLLELENALQQVNIDNRAPEDALRDLIHQLLEAYRHADDCHKVQLTCTSALTDEQRKSIRTIENRIVEFFAVTIERINPTVSRRKLKPLTLSLFGSLNWTYLWFRDDGPVSREEYAEMLATTFLNGVGAVK